MSMRSPKTGTPRLTRSALVIAAAAATALLAGCASAGTAGSAAGGGGSASAPIQVGLLYSKTGLLAPYGKQYDEGFQAGLAYATHGTGKVNGHQVQITEQDDTGDPATAVADAKSLIGKGCKVIVGTTDSGIGLQLAPLAEQNQTLYIVGAAATDKLTGINKYTFRAGRESYQDIAAAASFVGDPTGKKVLVLAQDSAFGQANVEAVKAVLGAKGATVSSVLAPPSATDLTPFARQVKSAKPDLVYVAWAGATATSLWTALNQQGVLGSTKVVTGMAGSASYPIFGDAGTKISFLAHYFPGAGGNNPVETAMINGIKQAGGTPDLFSADGFNTALMLVHALSASATDTGAMVKSLEGWSFNGPKGPMQVRAADHALLQPMFQASLTGTGPAAQPKLIASLTADQVAPPVKTMAG